MGLEPCDTRSRARVLTMRPLWSWCVLLVSQMPTGRNFKGRGGQKGWEKLFYYRGGQKVILLQGRAKRMRVLYYSQSSSTSRGVSEPLRQVLAPWISGLASSCYRPYAKFCHNRRPQYIPELERPNIVYEIPYASCPARYIGLTGRKLKQHLDEHKRACRYADFNPSALA